MLDRGLRRSFPAGVERAAQDARPPDVPRRDLTALATFTIDPVTARDFDDAISCEVLGDEHWRVWVHIADVSAYVRPGGAVDREAYRRSTSVYVPGAVEPMLPEALSNDACSLRPGVERLAGHRRARAARRARRVKVGVLPLDDPLRRAPGLRPRRSHLRRRRGRGGAVGAAAGRGARGGGRAPGAPREPRRAGRRVGRARVRLRPPRPPRRGGGDGPDRVAPAHRAPDDRRQRGGRHAAVRALDPGALPRPRAARAAIGAAAGRAARVAGRRDAAGARAAGALAGGRHRRAVRGAGRPARAPHRPRPPGAHDARAALAQAGPLLAREPRSRRPAVDALLPLHLAHPPLPRPRLPPGAAQRRGRRGGRAARRHARRGGRVDVGARARRDGHRARRRRRRSLLPARARHVRRRLGHGLRRRDHRPHQRRRVRRPSAPATRGCCRSAACAATGGSSTSTGRCSSASATTASSASAIP